MKSKFLSVTIVILSCVLMIILSSCNRINTDEDRFFVDNDNRLRMIDIKKTGPDIVVPEKVGDKVIRIIYLEDSYFSKIDSIDVSNVSELEYFTLELWGGGSYSKLKRLDFRKNKKLRDVTVNRTKALEEIIFNKNCETVCLFNTYIKELDLKLLKKLNHFTYWHGPLESIDLSNNTNLDQVWIKNANIKTVDIKKLKKLKSIVFYGVPLEELDISNNPNLVAVRTYNTNVKVLDVSNNPKLKFIEVDEGTEIIGETNAEIKYWTKEDIERLEEKSKDN